MDTPARIDLAVEPSFVVGKLSVRPSLLEVEAGGVRHAVPPRVMQVLVALAGADSRTVSRDELAERCWQGRIVGEDALNRIIAKLRAVAQGPGEGSFAIETVKRIGYRLVTFESLAPAPRERADAALPTRRHWPLLSGAMLVGAAAVGLWFTRAPDAMPNDPPVAAATDLETRGLSAVFEGGPARTAEGIGYLQQAILLQPRRAKTWGSLAMAYVLSLPDTPIADRDAVVARIRETARRGQLLDPSEGRSIAAEASLVPTFGHWSEKDRVLRKGLQRAARGSAPLIFQQVQFLTAVGRIGEALELVNELNVTTPLVPWIQAARINLLAASGRPEEAERVAAWAGGVWPRNRLIWFTRFDLATYGGRPARAIALAAAGAPERTEPQEVALAVATARAIESRAPDEMETVLAQYLRLAPTGQSYAECAVRAAAALGKTREAFAFATMLYSTDTPPGPRSVTFPRIGFDSRAERNTSVLFVPPASRLAMEPGFAALVTQIGLADYWRRTGLPDFCHGAASTSCATLPQPINRR